MNDTHLELLKTYAATRDAEAFASIVDAYRDLVYSVCLRVMGNPASAEDVTQACFVTLARRAGEVRSSVAGWLHARATALSLTYLKRERNRRLREREYASHRPEESEEPNWEQIAPEVDQALLELPEDLREILVAHFLQRKAQVCIAEEMGLSAPTVCRRIKAGIEALRSQLATRGVVASVAVLEVALRDHALSQAPETLARGLGKLAMAGIAAPAAASRMAGFVLAGAVIVAAVAGGVALTMHQAPPRGGTGVSTVTKPTRVVLRNLHPMVNWNLGQNYQINGYLQFQMECLGESKEYDYWFFAGVGGDNHTQVFTADTSKWCHSLSQIDFSPDFVKTLYDAVGYDFTYVTEQEFNADRPRYIEELVRCIDRGIPVIAKETGSSTRSKVQEFSLLVGYEDSGSQLLFVEGDSTKPYKVPTNQNVSYLFVIPGAKKQAPPLAEVYRKAVLSIPALLTRPQKGDVYFGREAFDAWAKHLLAEDYAGWTNEQLDEKGNLPLWRLHTTYVCIVATNGSDRHFLDRAEKLCPDLPFIREVNKEYAEMGRLWKDEMDATGGSFNITKETIRNKEAKRPIAEFIQRYVACCDRILDIYRANGYASIQTARLVVRQFSPDDWKELQQLATDKKNTGGDRYDHAWPTDDKGAGEMARWCAGQRCFAVCLKDSGKLIGFVRFNSVDDKGQLDLGHMFHSRYRDERYASEAIQPLLGVAFADAKVKGVVARNAVEWPGQLTPLIELGFRELERGEAPNFNGAEGGPRGFVACRMRLTRAEWETSKAQDLR